MCISIKELNPHPNDSLISAAYDSDNKVLEIYFYGEEKPTQTKVYDVTFEKYMEFWKSENPARYIENEFRI